MSVAFRSSDFLFCFKVRPALSTEQSRLLVLSQYVFSPSGQIVTSEIRILINCNQIQFSLEKRPLQRSTNSVKKKTKLLRPQIMKPHSLSVKYIEKLQSRDTPTCLSSRVSPKSG